MYNPLKPNYLFISKFLTFKTVLISFCLTSAKLGYPLWRPEAGAGEKLRVGTAGTGGRGEWVVVVVVVFSYGFSSGRGII